jgi:5-methyltetrahydropteroyltriglutamate--homocysteine methyltransferase
VNAGASYVQLDSPRYTHMVSEEGRANLERLGIDPSTWLRQMIALDNELIDTFPDLTWGLHLCRGNHRSMWSVEGGYDAIAEQLFSEIHVDRLALEYDSPRAGTFAPLRFVPSNKVVILGLITTKEPELEGKDLLVRRVEEAARYVPLERLALSPQCGFASTLPGNQVTEDIQRAKLSRLTEVALTLWA